jgi:hypothetical protein
VVRYDNERARAITATSVLVRKHYHFRSVETLVDDFIGDIDQMRRGQNP